MWQFPIVAARMHPGTTKTLGFPKTRKHQEFLIKKIPVAAAREKSRSPAAGDD
jgi:hypothetical protein